MLGAHGAELVLSNLDVDPELRIKALNIMNHTIMVTAHGQTHDIVNEITTHKIPLHELDKVMQWKTAHYSILNPIHMGMVLAGAPCEDTNAITEYALNIGKAYQITDDLLLISDEDSGKNAIDDIKEGKQTILTLYADHHASEPSREFIRSCLGNPDVGQEDFSRFKKILHESGAVVYAEKAAEHHIEVARKSLREHSKRWNATSVIFLDELAKYLLKRTH
jgi:geranylgeranyl diphosphate synthase, type I